MKGIIFNLLEEVVVAQHGDEAWDRLLDETVLPGTYTSLGSYPDEEIEKLVAAAAQALKLEKDDVLRWFGKSAMPLLAERYPQFFPAGSKTLAFVLSVNGIIHPEVRKLYQGAHCPHFGFQQSDDGSLLMSYNSPRKFCALAQGFIEGAAEHFGESAVVEHISCMQNGDSECLLRIETTEAVNAHAA